MNSSNWVEPMEALDELASEKEKELLDLRQKKDLKVALTIKS